MRSIPTEANVPPTEPADQRLLESRKTASDDVRFEEAFGQAMRIAGGADWLARVLDERPSYTSRIYDGIEGREGRQIQGRWIVEVTRDPKAALHLIGWLCRHAGLEPPVIRKKVDRAQLAAAVLAEVERQGGVIRDGVLERAAAALGVRVEDLP